MNGKTDYKIGELTGLLTGIKGDISEIKDFMCKYDQRLMVLETSNNRTVGAMAVISALVSFGMMIVAGFIQKVIASWK